MLVVCVISALTTYHGYAIILMETWILCCLALSLVVFIGCVVLICQQPQTSRKVSFMVSIQMTIFLGRISLLHHDPSVFKK